MRLSRIRAAAVAAIMGMTVLGGTAQVASAAPQAGDLYYDNAGYIMRVPLAGGTPQRMVKVGGASVTGIAVTDGRLFWITEAGLTDSLSYVTLGGAPHVRQLVGGLPFPDALVAAGGWLYWADQDAIGRVRPDGAQLNRRFLVLRQENGGGVAEGLATDGSHLYFSRCQDGTIGRVDLSGAALDMSFIRLPGLACPQGLAVGSDHVYWTELGGHVGRATLQGTGAKQTWLSIGEGNGPFNLSADGSNLYWDWGGGAGTPEYVGTARVTGAGVRTHYLLGQGAFLDTAPGAS
jgi:hypothetical protein